MRILAQTYCQKIDKSQILDQKVDRFFRFFILLEPELLYSVFSARLHAVDVGPKQNQNEHVRERAQYGQAGQKDDEPNDLVLIEASLERLDQRVFQYFVQGRLVMSKCELGEGSISRIVNVGWEHGFVGDYFVAGVEQVHFCCQQNELFSFSYCFFFLTFEFILT